MPLKKEGVNLESYENKGCTGLPWKSAFQMKKSLVTMMLPMKIRILKYLVTKKLKKLNLVRTKSGWKNR